MHLFYVLIAAALFNLHSFTNGQQPSHGPPLQSTDGKNGEKPPAAVGGLTFGFPPPKGGHCDEGLLICYQGIFQQHIVGISGSNFRAKRTFFVRDENIRKRMALKKRLAVQFVSNCNVPSGRDLLTARLQQLLQVDVYGKCNNRVHCKDECYQREQGSHFFYLAFENAVCPNYVTEKFWKALRNLVVPIVLSRKVMEEVGIPNGTFIAVDDFNSVKALVDYLKKLQRDKDKYMGFFNWTKAYQKHRSGHGIQPPLCQLCEIAHTQRHSRDTIKTYAQTFKDI
ncbi:hypothetical protein niasHT_010648 [Heterodera trifolii]|uniref:Fucosyltransferase n=1 Tax=Heterodera trifolii TaxID=157864 RepID=A0ABD2LGX5_9BILA